MSSTRIETATSNGIRTPVAMPDPSEIYGQDQEWCVVRTDGQWREIRFHDYSEVYSVPGLYERIFYDILECRSPATIAAMLGEAMKATGAADDQGGRLRALDLGAGNGIMGEELRALDSEVVVGVDIIEEAAEAAERDRPEVYDDYFVVDMTDLEPGDRATMERYRFNCLTCVAALGFGDIPPEAFRTAYNLLETGGWVGFNIKEDFLEDADRSGFSELIKRSLDDGRLEVKARKRYQHRLGTGRQPIHYIGMVGVKRDDLPAL